MFWKIVVVAVLYVLYKIYCKFTQILCKSNTCLAGKTVIITGGNTDLSYETALILASRGGRIILADKRDATEKAIAIIKSTNNKNVSYKHLDLSSISSIRRFAEMINEEENRLDILIHNVGILGFGREMTEDNLPFGNQINYFGPFLLTHLLVDLMKKAASSRILFQSSLVSFRNELTEEFLDEMPKPKAGFMSELLLYGNTTLLNIKICIMFADKLRNYGITANTFYPGLITTQTMNNYKGRKTIMYWVVFLFYKTLVPYLGRTPWEAAQLLAICALSKDLEKVSGKFLVKCQEFIPPLKTRDHRFRAKLWRKTEELLKLTDKEKLE